ncbi:MAG: DMT family transporter [Gammaproteobacteria bacterium]|nr:DMT family transporter [Gammaproteobacteria bacterium]
MPQFVPPRVVAQLMTNERLALTCGILAVLLWSTVATGFKLGLTVLAPTQLLFVGSTVSLTFFAAALVATGRMRALLLLDTRQLANIAGLGLLNPAIYYLILFEAYDRLPAQIAQPLNYTWAITLALLAVPILKQPLTRRTLLGIVVSYVGVAVLLTTGASITKQGLDPLGVALALISTLVWSSYWLLSVRMGGDTLINLCVGFAVGTPIVAAVCAFTTGLPPLSISTIGYGAWVGLIEMGVTFLLWQTALNRTGNAGRMGQLIFLSPFISLVLIDRVLGEAVAPSSIIALLMIVAGIVVARRD